MTQTVLIIGGMGRIGSRVASDILTHTAAKVYLTGRTVTHDVIPKPLRPFPAGRIETCRLELEQTDQLQALVKGKDLVVHCAGPFHFRQGKVLQACIEQRVNYVDVSDHRSFYQTIQPLKAAVQQAGITAIINTGVFPGISNSLVKLACERCDRPDTIHLSYVVAGSGGAGLTVMRTTFLGLRAPFLAWRDGQWQTVEPYTEREKLDFPPPYNRAGVYWFDMPETLSLPQSFPVRSVITKFGSLPDFYNHLTWITAHLFPPRWVNSPQGLEFLARVSYAMTQVSDRITGVGVAIRALVTTQDSAQAYQVTFIHPHTAIAAGAGTGSIVQLMLEEELIQAGIYPVEQLVSSAQFRSMMAQRELKFTESSVRHEIS